MEASSQHGIAHNHWQWRSQVTNDARALYFGQWEVGGVLTKAAGIQSELVLTRDFSILAHSTGLHQY